MQRFRVTLFEKEVVFVLSYAQTRVGKVAARPRALYQTLIANPPDLRVKVRKRFHEWDADLTEVDTDYHV
jgi:hypothetical protein